MTPKVWSIKEKISKEGQKDKYNKKKVYSVKDIIKRLWQAADLEKMFINHMSNKGLCSEYIENTQNSRVRKQPNLRADKVLEKSSPKRI